MKLRILDNSLRLRVTQTELDTFAKKGKVSSSTTFPGGEKMTYTLTWAEDDTFSITFKDNSIVATVSKSAGKKWLEASEVSIERKTSFSIGEGFFKLLVEKDFKCLTERIEEDESDMFPNPNTNC